MKFREYQKETIDLALKKFEEVDTVIIEAPTGFGKSLVNCIIANNFFDSYYTTPQISLLEQLEKDELINRIADISIVKGRDKYICPINKKPCSVAPCVLEKRKCNVKCPYYTAREKALESKIAAISFAYLMSTKDIADWGHRELLIVDEADDLESWAVDFSTIRFKVNYEFSSIHEIVKWAENKLSNVIAELKYLRESEDDKVIPRIIALSKLEQKLELFLTDAKKNPYNWVFSQNRFLELKPVDVGTILNMLVWNRANYKLITSATIIDPYMFKKTVGLKGKSAFIRVPHIIPTENRKVVLMPVGKMTKNERISTYRKLVDAIEKIAEKHKGEKGIIHCHSYEIANNIMYRLRKFNVITHNSKNREEKLKEFLESKDGIFLSVGFERGIDLKYDLARWQVITKCPYPDITDPRVKEIWINRRNWRWARYQAIKTLVQASGRIVRAKDDYGVTYILDSSVQHLLRYKREFPDWFLQAITYFITPKNL